MSIELSTKPWVFARQLFRRLRKCESSVPLIRSNRIISAGLLGLLSRSFGDRINQNGAFRCIYTVQSYPQQTMRGHSTPCVKSYHLPFADRSCSIICLLHLWVLPVNDDFFPQLLNDSPPARKESTLFRKLCPCLSIGAYAPYHSCYTNDNPSHDCRIRFPVGRLCVPAP